MSIARRAAWLPLAVVVAAMAASPAHAATATWRTPTDNATYTSLSNVDFVASISRGLTEGRSEVVLGLTVPGPQPGPYRVASTTGSELRFSFTPGCANHAGPCSSGAPAYNGRYVASLSGAASGQRTVVLEIPPAAPTGVTATATGQRRIQVSWSANREPDLTAYDVFTADGVSIAASLPADTLSYEFELPESGYGGEHSYVVRAHRLACANCPDTSSQLASPMSQAASVTLNEPTPEPDPTTNPDGGGNTGSGGTGTGGGSNNGGGYNGGGGGTGGGTGGGSNTGGGTGGSSGEPAYNDGSTSGQFNSGVKPTTNPTQAQAQQRAAFGLTFKNFAPKLGAPKLPPLPKFTEAPLPEGTYDPMLEYGPQEAEGPGSLVAEKGGFTTTLVESFSSVFEGRKLFRSIAIALLLLLAAGHLRVWLRGAPQ